MTWLSQAMIVAGLVLFSVVLTFVSDAAGKLFVRLGSKQPEELFHPPAPIRCSNPRCVIANHALAGQLNLAGEVLAAALHWKASFDQQGKLWRN